jgi:hypothetical protein
MIFLALFLSWQAGFVFSGIQPWRWSEGRGEYIPALSAVLDNSSGQDFATARFLVRVHCQQGGVREYPVLLRDVLMGRQQVEFTAYDSIGSVFWCPGPAEIVPVEAVPYPEQERPAFVVFGFRRFHGGERVPTALEGILDYRQPSSGQQLIELRSWRRYGARLELPECPMTDFYLIRVPPGRLGLAGFVFESAQESRSPLTRFLRFYDLQPGKATFLGVFQLEQFIPGRRSLLMDPAPELTGKLAAHIPRPVVAARGLAPPPGWTLVQQ